MTLRADLDLKPRPSGEGERGTGARRHRHPLHPAPHQRRARLIGRVKLALPLLAAVILALIVAWPQFRKSSEDRFQLGFSGLSSGKVQNLSMVNARYHGVDRHNRPFAVSADVATEDQPGSGLMVLDQPKADFNTPGGASIYMEARRGFYQQKTQILELQGEVNLFHDEGYELHTEKARLDLKAGTAEGALPVVGQGPTGRINGQGFTVLEKGGQILVTGQSVLNVRGARSK